MKKLNNYHRVKRIIFISVIMIIFIGCVSITYGPNLYVRIDEKVENNDFDAAIQTLIELQQGPRPLYNERNVISLFLNRGVLEHYAGNYRESANHLLNAERLIQEAFTKSISENVASYILNDNTKEYPGEDFEDIYISVFNALNFFKMGNIDGALVEIRKLTLPSGKLDMLERKYQGLNDKARQGSKEELNQIENSPDASRPVSKSVNFTNSALARYLSVLFYQADGNHDAVRIELEQLKAAFASQPSLYTTNLPKAVENLTAHTPYKARLDLISFTGLSPIKEEEELIQYFPFFQSPLLHFPIFKLPVLVGRSNRINRVEVVVSEQKFDLEIIEDISAVVIDTFNARFSNIFLKTYIRTLVKYTALDIADAKIKEKNQNRGFWGDLAQGAGLVIAKAAFDSTERADIRMSRFLPDKAYIGNIHLDPGVYTVTLNYYSGRVLLRTDIYEDVDVKLNTVNLVNTVNLDSIRGR